MFNRKNLLLILILTPGFIGGVCINIWFGNLITQHPDLSIFWWYEPVNNLRTVLMGITSLPIGIAIVLAPKSVMIWLKGTFLSKFADPFLASEQYMGLRILGLIFIIGPLGGAPYAFGKLIAFLKTAFVP